MRRNRPGPSLGRPPGRVSLIRASDLGAPPGAATKPWEMVYQRTTPPVKTKPHKTRPFTHAVSRG
jgi:hypothetical protein